MNHIIKRLLGLFIEIITAACFLLAFVLEIIYIDIYQLNMFSAIQLIVPVVGFYILFVLLQMHLDWWNIFIPATELNQTYAKNLVRGWKLFFVSMTLYTSVCDLNKQTSQNSIFWIILAVTIIYTVFCKYKMWSISKKNKK